MQIRLFYSLMVVFNFLEGCIYLMQNLYCTHFSNVIDFIFEYQKVNLSYCSLCQGNGKSPISITFEYIGWDNLNHCVYKLRIDSPQKDRQQRVCTTTVAMVFEGGQFSLRFKSCVVVEECQCCLTIYFLLKLLKGLPVNMFWEITAFNWHSIWTHNWEGKGKSYVYWFFIALSHCAFCVLVII